jgi:hypothetical protein
LLVGAGCSREVKPGVTYTVSVLSSGHEGPAILVEQAPVESVQEVSHEGHTLSLLVRKTQYGKATFALTFPDGAVHLVQVKADTPRDVLPRGQTVGVRIKVHQSH